MAVTEETVTFVKAPPNASANDSASASDSASESEREIAPVRAVPTAGKGERYERGRVLGKGGMGTVFLVRDHTVGRDVALKQLHEEETDAETLARFEREARVQGQLEHPAIVPVYDVGTSADGKKYFTMKRVRGKSLAEVLAERRDGEAKEWSLRKLLSAFSQLCAAVHYAHERGVVHRDIKPTNVMLGAYGEVYLLDWGVAKTPDDPGIMRRTSDVEIDAKVGIVTGVGSVMGTLTTMAPEQAAGGEVDARSDVYALGAVLFEILTGLHLHPIREDVDAMLDEVAKGVETRASVRAPHVEVPPELEELCYQATRFHPRDRLPSAKALRDAIEAYLDGDRDVELRREAARKHAELASEAARETLAGAEKSREIALGEVGKALAFDPENRAALATLVKLLTTPPQEIPPEVQREFAVDLQRNLKNAGIAAVIVYGYINAHAFVTWQLGVKDSYVFVMTHLLWPFALAFGVITIFKKSYPPLLTACFFGVVTSALLTWLYGPYLLVPILIVGHAALFSLIRPWKARLFVIGTSCLAWTVSVFGQRWGIFPETVRFIDGGMTIHSTVLAMPEAKTTTLLYSAGLGCIIGPAVVIGALRSAYHRAESTTRLQAWQLRRLVSSSDPK